ncbi:hypothetical protein J6590_020644 [Homalodisca vitripennis]|nr:hypothetical protein J6590_020644 [Homalodisca vitripennis]
MRIEPSGFHNPGYEWTVDPIQYCTVSVLWIDHVIVCSQISETDGDTGLRVRYTKLEAAVISGDRERGKVYESRTRRGERSVFPPGTCSEATVDTFLPFSSLWHWQDGTRAVPVLGDRPDRTEFRFPCQLPEVKSWTITATATELSR